MRVYKVIFARNEIIVCQESSVRLPMDTDIRYEANNGFLIYAFVRAENMTEACQKANMLVPRLVSQLARPSGGPSSNSK